MLHKNIDAIARKSVLKKQNPFATIIGCSDSRVPVELIFDKGIGELFVIRVAGNICDTDEIGSIEYGVGHLNTPVLVVLGHTNCGAVTAVCKNAELHGSIPELVDNIIPAVEKIKDRIKEITGERLIEESIRENVWNSIKDLLDNSEITRNQILTGKLKVVGAIYDLNSGMVDRLGTHPMEHSIISKYKKTYQREKSH